MRIKESNKPDKLRSFLSGVFSNRKRWVLILFVLFVAAGVAAVWGNRKVKTKGFNNLAEFLTYTTRSYISSFRSSPEKVTLDIKLKDFEKLSEKRDEALKRGLIVNEEDSYVPGKIRYKDKTYDIKLRLKGHMTDHIQGQKWSFRVKVRSKEPFMGMKIFSLQHPGTRGYIYEWIYHKLMKRENIIALRYSFVKLDLNGKDLGIYAVEENFDQELILSNNRPSGPIIRFNPDLYWVDRYHEIIRQKTNAEFAEYNSSNVEPYRTEKILSDTLMRKYFLRAQELIESFRRGNVTASEIFDIKYLARFHAIIDLVGGHHSLDWSDIKYYYNPTTDRLEPVAYESFTVFPARQISGSFRFRVGDKTSFHTRLFSDEVFFREYISNLERMSEPAYLKSFFTEIEDELYENLDILNSEFPYKKFDEGQYLKNQSIIRQILNTPKGFHAFLADINKDKILLKIGSIESLPVEISSISYNDKIVTKLDSTVIILPKENNKPVSYKTYEFSLLGTDWRDTVSGVFKVNYSVLGSSENKAVEVFKYDIDTTFTRKPVIAHSGFKADFIIVNDSARIIYMKPGSWKLNKSITIPAGYKVFIEGGFVLDLVEGGMLLSASPFIVRGNAEQPVIFKSSDDKGMGVLVMNTTETSEFRNVHFINLKPCLLPGYKITGAVSFIDSPVTFTDCYFFGVKTEDALNINGSSVTINHCKFEEMANDGLDINNARGSVSNTSFTACNENGIDISMSSLVVSNILLNSIGDKAINIKAGGTLSGKQVSIKSSVVGISGEDLCDVNLTGVTIDDCRYGAIAFTNKKRGGCASVRLNEVKLNKTVNTGLIEDCSVLVINGKEIKEKVADVERAVK